MKDLLCIIGLIIIYALELYALYYVFKMEDEDGEKD